MAGECVELSWNTMVRDIRVSIMPTKLMIISFFLPVLSTKNMLMIVPRAFKPEVIRESAKAVLFDANPAN